MKKIIFIFLVLIIVIFSYLFKEKESDFVIDESKYKLYTLKDDFILKNKQDLRITIQIEDDQDIYNPSAMGYRFGPSIIYNADGSLDIYTSSPGNSSTEWDYIRYRHYENGQYSKEKIVLKPTKNSLDHYSCCDPGVIYFDGYYYLAYTSTANKNGVDNCVYVARSQNPDGPFEKWNGEGWGGEPVAIIYYDGDERYYGAGEPSFLIKDNKLYCYYSWICENGSYTKLSIADLDDNWPLTLSEYGVVLRNKDCDAVDVCYVKEYQKYLALGIHGVFDNQSSIRIYESNDGLNFYEGLLIKDKVAHHALCLGISKRKDGSLSINDKLYLGYAHSGGQSIIWGKFALKMAEIKIQQILEID